jgi:hypothetical protein
MHVKKVERHTWRKILFRASPTVLQIGFAFMCLQKNLKNTYPTVWHLDFAILLTWALFSSHRNPKFFQDSLSHQILRHMRGALNIDENKN